MTATAEFWATVRAHPPEGPAAFDSVRWPTPRRRRWRSCARLPLETEADRATMDAFVPLAERWIELFRRQAAAEGATGYTCSSNGEI